jgi:pyruvate,water dikinase
VVGAENATQALKTGTEVTVSCADGEVGVVYGGKFRSRSRASP